MKEPMACKFSRVFTDESLIQGCWRPEAPGGLPRSLKSASYGIALGHLKSSMSRTSVQTGIFPEIFRTLKEYVRHH